MPLMLGKLPAKVDPRSLKLVNYLAPEAFQSLPETVRWDDVKPQDAWGMDGNDRLGNCVIATAAHIIDCANANEAGSDLRIPDAAVVQLSHEMGATAGYYVLDRLKHWRSKGMFDTKIKAFCRVSHLHQMIKAAIYIFGHADIGLNMPRAWENTEYWNSGRGSEYYAGSWGGHSVALLGYAPGADSRPLYFACTWGRIVTITAEAMEDYCDEIYVSLLPNWCIDGSSPSGFNLVQLEEDLARLV